MLAGIGKSTLEAIATNTRKFYRTDVDLTEKTIGVAILFLLVGVAFIVVREGSNYDPTQYTGKVGSTDLAALHDHCQYKVDYPEIIKRAETNFA